MEVGDGRFLVLFDELSKGNVQAVVKELNSLSYEDKLSTLKKAELEYPYCTLLHKATRISDAVCRDFITFLLCMLKSERTALHHVKSVFRPQKTGSYGNTTL